MYKTLCFVAILVAAEGSTQVEKCQVHPVDLPLNADVAGCEVPPCKIPQLQDAIVEVTFKSDRVVRAMRTRVNAFLSIGPITLPPVNYDLEEFSHTCNFLLNTYCPILPQEVVRYKLSMYIQPFFPVGTAVDVEFRIVDESDETVTLTCLRLAMEIVSPIAPTNEKMLD